VCYHATLALEFDKDIPEYDLGECVHITVTAADEEGQPLDGTIASVLSPPDSSEITDLEWTSSAPGIYSTSYLPEQEGVLLHYGRNFHRYDLLPRGSRRDLLREEL
jgi:hypothetical protein